MKYSDLLSIIDEEINELTCNTNHESTPNNE